VTQLSQQDLQRLAMALMGSQQQPMGMPAGPRQILQNSMQQPAQAPAESPLSKLIDPIGMMGLLGKGGGGVSATSPQTAMTAYNSMPASYIKPGM
jgi:hypothetical protein